MSVHEGQSDYAPGVQALRLGEDDSGYGWVVFAGVMLGVLATINIIEGIAAIGNAHFFVGNTHYVFGDLNAWGWTVMLLGVAQGLAAAGIFVKNQFARWAGVAFAGLNAIAQLLFIPAYPAWSLSLFAVDLLVIYALTAHGGRSYRST
jgi:hypothetical protein